MLSEQIIGLCDPTPISKDLDWFDDDETRAKVCSYNSENDNDTVHYNQGLKKNTLRKDIFETDPKYAGKPVSRKTLSKQWGMKSCEGNELEFEQKWEKEPVEDDSSEGEEFEADPSELEEQDESYVIGEECEDHVLEGNKEEHVTEELKSMEQLNEDETDDLVISNEDVTASLRESVTEDLEKGKAVKNQISIWDGLLEGRMRLQKVLPLINRLPQGEMIKLFEDEANSDKIKNSLNHSRTELNKLLNSLLDLQKQLLLKNTTTSHILHGSYQSEVSNDCTDNNEEIPSDFSDDESSLPNDANTLPMSDLKRSSKSAKRQRNVKNEWENGSHEDYIKKIHEQFVPYRNDTITKWNEKLKLASGKITSKAFLHFDHSVMNHINYILQDKQRLRKRTQLKRTSYKVIGQLPPTKRIAMEPEESVPFKEYDKDIFDDDDFYHQLLKELIDRKTSQHSTDDPIELGRQWLELQKLRAKVKKKVDTKASKGRKLRYETHQKLSNFMTPVDKGQVANSARNDLFSSLFVSRSIAMANI